MVAARPNVTRAESARLESVDRVEVVGDQRDGHQSPAARPRRRRHAPAIVLGLFAALVVAFLVFVWWRYYTFDPAKGRLSPDEHPWFFPMLILHIASSSLAVATSTLQIWPWLRRRHRRVHRISGRVYVLAGVYPAATTSVVLTLWWPTSPLVSFRDLFVSVLWVAITTYGFMLARQRRVADHRRWMLRSFALTTPLNILGPLIAFPVHMILQPQLNTWFEGNKDMLGQASAATRLWLSFAIVVVAVEWWLERDQLRRSARHHAAAERRESTTVG